MQSLYDYKKFAILYVDDEEKSLKYFARAFEDQFRIYTAANAQDGLKILEAHKDEIGLLMTDQRMPGEKGIWLLEKARQLRPRIIRILATAYSDMEAAIAAVNTGAIYKYVTKPWDPPQLENTLKRGLEFFMVQNERDQLLREKMSVLHNMMIADRIVSLGLLAAGLSHHIRNSLVAVKTFLDLAPAGKDAVQVQLSDNGPGLPKEALRLVFDPFVVRSDSPMEYGIHLMACYFIVHHHGGRIDARSENGQGTTFTLRLPTNPNLVPPAQDEQEFLQKVLLSDSLWEKLISTE